MFGCLGPYMRGQRNTSRSQSLMRIAATRFLGVALLICSEVTVAAGALKHEMEFSGQLFVLRISIFR